MSAPTDSPRFAYGGPDGAGNYVYNWRLTDPSLTDRVTVVIPPRNVLPVVFVPGIMGSNLRNKSDRTPVWRLDEMRGATRLFLNHGPLAGQPLGLVKATARMTPGDRQRVLNPASLEVDPSGHVPDELVGSITDAKDYTARGWGEVGESSYMAYLLWLEQHLNGEGYNPAQWKDFYYVAVRATPEPGQPSPVPRLFPDIAMTMRGLPDTAEIGGHPESVMSDDLLKRATFRMPVYACGYNWLSSNLLSATRLEQRINQIIEDNNRGGFKCEQVVIVTHSMGGLVARACQMFVDMQDKIAGIVHGVMPTTGAAVAYRRCKVGMRDEDPAAGIVIGETGQAVTAVFSQSPGALQLLPTEKYESSWLTFGDNAGATIATSQPSGGDPYQDIYLRTDRWWGLVRSEWLHPKGGVPITWEVYQGNVAKARQFASAVKGAFHPETYVFYGDDPEQKSFARVHWQVTKGAIVPTEGPAPKMDQVASLPFTQVRASGNNPLYVGGGVAHRQMAPADPMLTRGDAGLSVPYQTSYWEIRCGKQDSGGDGTVPVISGAAPKHLGGAAIKQQFGLHGFQHEGAYRNPVAQTVSLYGIVKIASNAKVPA